jgi:hypothetical protein
MPMSPKHRATFYSLPVWAETRSHLQALAREQNLTYITASDWVKNGENFEDTVHLNEQGARLFSTRLGMTLSKMDVGKAQNLVASAAKP